VSSQASNQSNLDERIQNYQYDGARRLINWSDGSQSLQIDYDRMGNRNWHYNAFDTTHYSYAASPGNRLELVSNGLNTSQYQYNKNGAVSYICKINPLDTLMETFSYTMGGQLSKYVLEGQDFRDWRYRQSPFGGREQKRIFASPTGDTLGYTHAWVYYILGAGGTQLARWHGRQTRDYAGPEDCGRRVYMYPLSYLTK